MSDASIPPGTPVENIDHQVQYILDGLDVYLFGNEIDELFAQIRRAWAVWRGTESDAEAMKRMDWTVFRERVDREIELLIERKQRRRPSLNG